MSTMDAALEKMRGAAPATTATPKVAVDVLSASEARKYAERKASDLGVPFPKCPAVSADMSLPDDITTLGSEELGKLLGKYTAFSAYLEAQVSLLGIDSHCAEATLDYVRNKTLLSAQVQTGYDKAAEKKAATDTNIDVLKLQASVSKVKAEYETVEALLRAYEKLANAISREITRRSALAHLEGRSA